MVVLPILNPIVYGVRTWSIQERVAHLLSLGVSCRGAQLFTGTASNTSTAPHGALCKAGSACHYFHSHFQLHSSCPWPLEAGVRSRQHVGKQSRGAGGGATRPARLPRLMPGSEKTEEKQLLLPCSSTKKEKWDDRRNLTLLSLTSAPNKVMEK